MCKNNNYERIHVLTYSGDGAGDHIFTIPSESVLAIVEPQLLKRH